MWLNLNKVTKYGYVSHGIPHVVQVSVEVTFSNQSWPSHSRRDLLNISDNFPVTFDTV